MTTTVETLRALGYDVRVWDMPGIGRHLQVTQLHSGIGQGITVYVPELASLQDTLYRIEAKRLEFEQQKTPER